MCELRKPAVTDEHWERVRALAAKDFDPRWRHSRSWMSSSRRWSNSTSCWFREVIVRGPVAQLETAILAMPRSAASFYYSLGKIHFNQKRLDTSIAACSSKIAHNSRGVMPISL